MSKIEAKNNSKSKSKDGCPSFSQLCSKFDSKQSSEQRENSLGKEASPKNNDVEPKSRKSKEDGKTNASKGTNDHTATAKPKASSKAQQKPATQKQQEENSRQYESFSLKEDYIFVKAIQEYQQHRGPRQKILEELSAQLERTVCSIRRRWERLTQFTPEQQKFISEYYNKYPNFAQDRKISFKCDPIVMSLGNEDERLQYEEMQFIKELKLNVLGLEEPEEPSEDDKSEDKSESDDQLVEASERTEKSMDENSHLSKGLRTPKKDRGEGRSKEKDVFDLKIDEMSPQKDLGRNNLQNQVEFDIPMKGDASENQFLKPHEKEQKEDHIIIKDQTNSERKDPQTDKIEEIGSFTEPQNDTLLNHSNLQDLSNLTCAPLVPQELKLTNEEIRRQKFKRIKTDYLSPNERLKELDFKLRDFRNAMMINDQLLDEKAELLANIITDFGQKYNCTIPEMERLFTSHYPLSMEDMQVKLCYYNIEKRAL